MRKVRGRKRAGDLSYDGINGLELDYSGTGRNWQTRWAAANEAIADIQSIIYKMEMDIELDKELGEETPPEVLANFETERNRLRLLERRRDLMILDVIKSVPRDILAGDAPADPDWTNPESLEYIRGDKWNEFLLEVTDGSNGSVRANF